ncbi:MAG TPA: UvrD-helicase domain-containing protein [Pyrinomonadaceae bacterium]|nr:UvrD-helicase domain-containing protein [Pyrinomonadaceae bacterium]
MSYFSPFTLLFSLNNLVTTKRKLEPAQAKAAYALDRHISVTAGPGAGKTTVLVERYLHILREKKPSSIDQIVAITFTNRAANEMRERLRKALDGLLRSARGAERARWMRYKRTLDGAVITTIHGFCMRLLREFPVEAGLDPQFRLLDEHRAATLLASAVEESLTEAIGRKDESVSRLTAGIGRPLLANALWEMYLRVRGQGLSFDQILRQTATSHAAAEDYDALCRELDAAMAALITVRGLTSRADEKRAAAEKSWLQVREILHSSEASLADYCGAILEFREAARPDARSPIASLVKQLDEILWGENKEKSFGRLPQMRFDLLARDYATALVKILKSIDRRFGEKKQELSALDFDDLQVRTLELLQRPEVLGRASSRYKFFLVDEFQDTNGLQRDLLEALVLKNNTRSNLFIVGDRKQSVYGFRGADVDVFSKMTDALIAAGGELVPLPLNFRSQPPLINFFNHLFARFFKPGDEVEKANLSELGYVEHELSEGKREARDASPLVELMIDSLSGEDDPKAKQTGRERDAKQVVQRIISLTAAPSVNYRDIALLFRAMTDVPVYEAEFRRAGIPFQTVLGKGFYEREEITDLIQLCRFLDNRTDELALAAMLRSPLCGISDNTLLALRLGPRIGETAPGESPLSRKRPRPLFQALRKQREIDFIDEQEREALDRTRELLGALIERRNRYPIGNLLRFAVEKSAYTTVIAANYDGAQRLANIEKLFNLAERFERSGAHLIRDFVKYVHDFETIGSRESEGQLDDSANAVKLMTIHQAKGLEFPVVIIPDLHRLRPSWEGYFLLDRHRGLTLKVPNGRGQMVSGRTFTVFNERSRWRENFESMRLLYVAATRAQDRLILSGATREIARLTKGDDSWLQLIWQALDLSSRSQSGLIELDEDTQLQLTLNLVQHEAAAAEMITIAPTHDSVDLSEDLSQSFPLLQAIEPERDGTVHRFSVTQLINYQRCPRQYYFDRVLHVPGADQMAVWNNAEAPEPPANLTATLKGAVIHRFCETFAIGDNPEARLRKSFADIVRSRQAELADRLVEIDAEVAIAELLPLAQNYLSSTLFERVERGRAILPVLAASRGPRGEAGLWSELSFRLRRPLGILSGAIDKLLITPGADEKGFSIEIIDFKTNRISSRPSTSELVSTSSLGPSASSPASSNAFAQVGVETVNSDKVAFSGGRARRPRSHNRVEQIAFEFDAKVTTPEEAVAAEFSLEEQVRSTALDYQLQMQAYALAVRQLVPSLVEGSTVISTLHFLEPNVEFHLPSDLLSPDACMRAIDDAMAQIVSSREPNEFPVHTATHCRMCNFLGICKAGREWLRSQRKSAAD